MKRGIARSKPDGVTLEKNWYNAAILNTRVQNGKKSQGSNRLP